MYPGTHALTNPDRPALIMTATGEIVTYAELEDRSRRAANWLFDAGLRPGDVVGVSRFTLPHHVPLKSSK